MYGGHQRDFVNLFKDALLTAALAFFLFLPLIAFRSDASLETSNLILVQRWPLLAGLVASIFVLRLAYSLCAKVGSASASKKTSEKRKESKFTFPVLTGAGFLFVLAMPWLPGISRYEIDLGILILTYVMLGWGLNIVVGFAGLLNLGYAAFFAIGAYTYALLATNVGLTAFLDNIFGTGFWAAWSFWICLPIAGIFAAAAGCLLGFPVLRLRGDYLAIVTLAFGEIIRLVLVNWVNFTGGAAGVSGVPRPSFFGFPFDASEKGFAALFGLTFDSLHRLVFLYYIILALALITYIATQRLRTLPIGRTWKALREDEIACKALGINTVTTKLTALAIGAMFGGIAGAFFATRQGFVSPESFTFMESAVVLAIVVLAGSSEIGIVLAATLMVGGVEALRNLVFLKAVFGPDFEPTHYRMLIFGLAMVVVMIWRPRGLLPDQEPSALLTKQQMEPPGRA